MNETRRSSRVKKSVVPDSSESEEEPTLDLEDGDFKTPGRISKTRKKTKSSKGAMKASCSSSSSTTDKNSSSSSSSSGLLSFFAKQKGMSKVMEPLSKAPVAVKMKKRAARGKSSGRKVGSKASKTSRQDDGSSEGEFGDSDDDNDDGDDDDGQDAGEEVGGDEDDEGGPQSEAEEVVSMDQESEGEEECDSVFAQGDRCMCFSDGEWLSGVVVAAGSSGESSGSLRFKFDCDRSVVVVSAAEAFDKEAFKKLNEATTKKCQGGAGEEKEGKSLEVASTFSADDATKRRRPLRQAAAAAVPFPSSETLSQKRSKPSKGKAVRKKSKRAPKKSKKKRAASSRHSQRQSERPVAGGKPKIKGLYADVGSSGEDEVSDDDDNDDDDDDDDDDDSGGSEEEEEGEEAVEVAAAARSRRLQGRRGQGDNDRNGGDDGGDDNASSSDDDGGDSAAAAAAAAAAKEAAFVSVDALLSEGDQAALANAGWVLFKPAQGSQADPQQQPQQELLGTATRRLFRSGQVADGLLVAFLPADSEDPPLWKNAHLADGELEDLELHEVKQAQLNFRLQLTKPRGGLFAEDYEDEEAGGSDGDDGGDGEDDNQAKDEEGSADQEESGGGGGGGGGEVAAMSNKKGKAHNLATLTREASQALEAQGWVLRSSKNLHFYPTLGRCLGKGTRRFFRQGDEGGRVDGTVVAFLVPHGEDPALFKNLHSLDGEIEDLEIHEGVKEATSGGGGGGGFFDAMFADDQDDGDYDGDPEEDDKRREELETEDLAAMGECFVGGDPLALEKVVGCHTATRKGWAKLLKASAKVEHSARAVLATTATTATSAASSSSSSSSSASSSSAASAASAAAAAAASCGGLWSSKLGGPSGSAFTDRIFGPDDEEEEDEEEEDGDQGGGGGASVKGADEPLDEQLDDRIPIKKYLVKWRLVSHLHLSWELPCELRRVFGPRALVATNTFGKKQDDFLCDFGVHVEAEEDFDGDDDDKNSGDIGKGKSSVVVAHRRRFFANPSFVAVERVLDVSDCEDGGQGDQSEDGFAESLVATAVASTASAIIAAAAAAAKAGAKNQKKVQVQGWQVSAPKVPRVLVKWRGLPYSCATWERADEVPNAAGALKAFFEREAHDPRAEGRSRKGKRDRKANTKEVLSASLPCVFENGGSLRDYQKEGVTWMLYNWHHNRSSLLADEMGLGKTLQTVTYLRMLVETCGVSGPFLVVAPLSTLGHWRREFEKWTNLNAAVYGGTAEDRAAFRQHELAFKSGGGTGGSGGGKKKLSGGNLKLQVLITSFEVCTNADAHHLRGIPWSVLVVDEAHRLKNAKSKLALGLQQYDFDRTLLLTGTPLQNNTKEFWALLNFLDGAAFGDEEDFERKYGELNKKEQLDSLAAETRRFMLRRMKEDVEKSVPPKEETRVSVELTLTQKRYYRALYEKNLAVLNPKGRTPNGMKRRPCDGPSLMNVAMELRKCCNHPWLLRGVRDDALAELHANAEAANAEAANAEAAEGGGWSLAGAAKAKATRIAETDCLVSNSGKLVFLDKLLPKLQREGHRVLIFSQFKIMLDLLEDFLEGRQYVYERLDGDVTGADRQSCIDRFQAPDAQSLCMLLSTKAGGCGINLVAADTVVIFDSDFNPQNDLQAQARCHRIGQTKAVTVYRLLCAKTYEMKMCERASHKLALDRAVLGTAYSSASTGEGGGGGGKGGSGGAMSKKEVEELLKRGAYDFFTDHASDENSVKFAEASIDDILKTNTSVIRQDNNQQKKRPTTAKADAETANEDDDEAGPSNIFASAVFEQGIAGDDDDDQDEDGDGVTPKNGKRGRRPKNALGEGEERGKGGEGALKLKALDEVDLDDPDFWHVLGLDQKQAPLGSDDDDDDDDDLDANGEVDLDALERKALKQEKKRKQRKGRAVNVSYKDDGVPIILGATNDSDDDSNASSGGDDDDDDDDDGDGDENEADDDHSGKKKKRKNKAEKNKSEKSEKSKVWEVKELKALQAALHTFGNASPVAWLRVAQEVHAASPSKKKKVKKVKTDEGGEDQEDVTMTVVASSEHEQARWSQSEVKEVGSWVLFRYMQLLVAAASSASASVAAAAPKAVATAATEGSSDGGIPAAAVKAKAAATTTTAPTMSSLLCESAWCRSAVVELCTAIDARAARKPTPLMPTPAAAAAAAAAGGDVTSVDSPPMDVACTESLSASPFPVEPPPSLSLELGPLSTQLAALLKAIAEDKQTNTNSKNTPAAAAAAAATATASVPAVVASAAAAAAKSIDVDTAAAAAGVDAASASENAPANAAAETSSSSVVAAETGEETAPATAAATATSPAVAVVAAASAPSAAELAAELGAILARYCPKQVTAADNFLTETAAKRNVKSLEELFAVAQLIASADSPAASPASGDEKGEEVLGGATMAPTGTKVSALEASAETPAACDPTTEVPPTDAAPAAVVTAVVSAPTTSAAISPPSPPPPPSLSSPPPPLSFLLHPAPRHARFVAAAPSLADACMEGVSNLSEVTASLAVAKQRGGSAAAAAGQQGSLPAAWWTCEHDKALLEAIARNGMPATKARYERMCADRDGGTPLASGSCAVAADADSGTSSGDGGVGGVNWPAQLTEASFRLQEAGDSPMTLQTTGAGAAAVAEKVDEKDFAVLEPAVTPEQAILIPGGSPASLQGDAGDGAQAAQALQEELPPLTSSSSPPVGASFPKREALLKRAQALLKAAKALPEVKAKDLAKKQKAELKALESLEKKKALAASGGVKRKGGGGKPAMGVKRPNSGPSVGGGGGGGTAGEVPSWAQTLTAAFAKSKIQSPPSPSSSSSTPSTVPVTLVDLSTSESSTTKTTPVEAAVTAKSATTTEAPPSTPMATGVAAVAADVAAVATPDDAATAGTPVSSSDGNSARQVENMPTSEKAETFASAVAAAASAASESTPPVAASLCTVQEEEGSALAAAAAETGTPGVAVGALGVTAHNNNPSVAAGGPTHTKVQGGETGKRPAAAVAMLPSAKIAKTSIAAAAAAAAAVATAALPPSTATTTIPISKAATSAKSKAGSGSAGSKGASSKVAKNKSKSNKEPQRSIASFWGTPKPKPQPPMAASASVSASAAAAATAVAATATATATATVSEETDDTDEPSATATTTASAPAVASS